MIIADYEEKGNRDTNKYSYDLDSNTNSNSVPIPISEIYLSANHAQTQYPDNHNKGIGKVHQHLNIKFYLIVKIKIFTILFYFFSHFPQRSHTL